MSTTEVDGFGIITAEAFGGPTVSRVFTGSVEQGAWLFGTGLDGDIHVNANPYTLADPLDGSKNLITNNVLQRNLVCSSLTIDSGCVLDLGPPGAVLPSMYLVFCSGQLTNLGTIQALGSAASTFTNGISILSEFGQGTAGAAGGTARGAGGGTWALGGQGGAGGASGGNSGGAAVSRSLRQAAGATSLLYLIALAGGGASTLPAAGGGGASGGGDNTNKGGGGGGGGALVFIAAAFLDNSAGTIKATGGAGGNGAGGNAAGGGGGGGGAVYLVTLERPIGQPYTGTPIPASNQIGTIDVTGGAAGSGVGTGANGSPGGSGNLYLIYAV